MKPEFSIQYRVVIKTVLGSTDTIRAITCDTEEAAKAITMPENCFLVGIYPVICKCGDFGSTEPYHDYIYRGFHINCFDIKPNDFHIVDVTVDCEYHGIKHSLLDALQYIDEYRDTNICGDPGRNVKFYVYSRSIAGGIRYLAWQEPAYWDMSGYFWANSFDDFETCLPHNNNEHMFAFNDPNRAVELIEKLAISFECDVAVWDVSDYVHTNADIRGYLPGIAVEVGVI